MAEEKLTVVVLAQENDPLLDACLQSLSWAKGGWVVFDSKRKVKVSLPTGWKQLHHQLEDDFAAHRNWVLEQIKTDWVLFVDSDEQVSEELAEKIQEIDFSTTPYQAFAIKRRDHFLGQMLRYGDTAGWQEVRLGRRQAGTWQGAVHERWVIPGPAGSLNGYLEHYPAANLAYFINKLNYYSSLRAHELYVQGKTSHWWQIVAYPVAKFFYLYLIKQGVRDRTVGFVHAVLMSFYSYLVRAKLYVYVKQVNKN